MQSNTHTPICSYSHEGTTHSFCNFLPNAPIDLKQLKTQLADLSPQEIEDLLLNTVKVFMVTERSFQYTVGSLVNVLCGTITEEEEEFRLQKIADLMNSGEDFRPESQILAMAKML